DAGRLGGHYRDETFASLRDFAQQIGADRPRLADAGTKNSQIDADSFAALRAFARQIGGNDSSDNSHRIVLAEAQQAKPAAKPGQATKAQAAVKAPVAGGEVDAYAVGSQVCMTCHAAQAASFALTVMGKIGRIRKGTMECENCHGPGSLHVKAGGGRGV